MHLKMRTPPNPHSIQCFALETLVRDSDKLVYVYLLVLTGTSATIQIISAQFYAACPVNCMAPQTSTELWDLIVYWQFTLDKSVAEISVLSRRTPPTIYTILKNYLDYGTLSNPLAMAHKGQKALDEGDQNYIVSILKANPLLFLDEIHQKLVYCCQVDVCLATISHTLWELSISHKNIRKNGLSLGEPGVDSGHPRLPGSPW